MRHLDRVAFAALALAVLLACKSKGSSGQGNDTPIQNGENFTGRYRSTWGDSTFTQNGSFVSATYGRGTMTCTATGTVLDCSWVEGSLTGKALLVKQSDRSIKGTWGSGASATNGGQWNFVPLDGGGSTAIPTGVVDFGGVYRSTYGDTTFTHEGAGVNARYPGGSMTCTVAGSNLDCTWREGGSYGRAHLTKQANGDISGTWGNGGSDRSGGTWLFRKK